MMEITPTFEVFDYFSSYHYQPFVYEKVHYPTIEHFYQGWKFMPGRHREYVLAAQTPMDAEKRGHETTRPLRKNWSVIKTAVMYKAISCKLGQCKHLNELLAVTAPEPIFYNSRNEYWGMGRDGKGQNHYGRLLEKFRKELIETTYKANEK